MQLFFNIKLSKPGLRPVNLAIRIIPVSPFSVMTDAMFHNIPMSVNVQAGTFVGTGDFVLREGLRAMQVIYRKFLNENQSPSHVMDHSMNHNFTVSGVSSEPDSESTMSGLSGHTIWLWTHIWKAYCLPSRTKTCAKTIVQQCDNAAR
jgi:hypothetical protein